MQELFYINISLISGVQNRNKITCFPLINSSFWQHYHTCCNIFYNITTLWPRHHLNLSHVKAWMANRDKMSDAGLITFKSQENELCISMFVYRQHRYWTRHEAGSMHCISMHITDLRIQMYSSVLWGHIKFKSQPYWGGGHPCFFGLGHVLKLLPMKYSDMNLLYYLFLKYSHLLQIYH